TCAHSGSTSAARLCCALVATGIGAMWVLGFHFAQFSQFAPPERAVRQLGVRNLEIGLVYTLPLEPYNVEVQRARAPANLARAPRGRLDAVQLLQQLARRELRVQQDHLVQKRVLSFGANWLG